MGLLYRTGRLAGVFIAILQIAACSYNVQSTRLQQHPPTDLPSAHELTQTPFFPQERYQCGPAALATVLGARGAAVQPEQLVEQVYLPAREGSVPIEMEAAARRHDMLVYPLSADMEALLREVAGGNPVLLLQNLGLSWAPRWHYAVMVGYDLAAGEAVLRSGTTRRYSMRLGVLETTWRRADYWARVMLPPDKLPETGEPLTYIRAALKLEQSGQQAAALESYRAASRRWPEQPLVWLAQGNLAYAQGDIEGAEESFRSGLEQVPGNSDLWNNLGYALAAKGCREQALKAVDCAISLAPDAQEYRDSREELQATGAAGAGCTVPDCPALGE